MAAVTLIPHFDFVFLEVSQALKYSERLKATLCCHSALLDSLPSGRRDSGRVAECRGSEGGVAVLEVQMLSPPLRLLSRSRSLLVPALAVLTSFAACSPPVERPTGWAQAYQDARDTFYKGDFERAIQFSEPIASASPANAFTGKALVLRAVIFAGEVKGYKELEEAYTKGIGTARNKSAKSEFERVRTDYRQFGTNAGLALAETALRLTKGGSLPKGLALEASYPSVEGPTELTALNRVKDGATVSADVREGAVRDAVRKGVDDTLAKLAGGDRSKARASFIGSAYPLKELDFSLFLDHQLVEAGSLFDSKHSNDPTRLGLVCDQADKVAEAALGLLKENPDKDKQKEVKKIQDEIKALRKSVQ